MFSSPESKAWAVLVTSFALFCALVVSVPLLVRSHIIHATTVEMTVLEDPIEGVVYVKEPGGADYTLITQRNEEIPEGAMVMTDERLRAFLRFFDDSTLTLYNDTEIVLERVRSPRYEVSSKANDIQIRVLRGRVGIGVASPGKGTTHIGVRSPHASMMLREGSYSVEIDPHETQLNIRTIRPGEATVKTKDDEQTFTWGRCRILEGQSIEGPLDPEQDLILNSDFSSPMGRGWEEEPPKREDENDPYGSADIVVQDGKALLSFTRFGATKWGETGIIQTVDKDVRDFSSLKLSCEVLVNWQSLPGGGTKSSEFPVMIELKYRDDVGNARSFYRGFYYEPQPSGREWVKVVNGEQVIQGEWYPYESENLMQSLGEFRPAHIDAIRVYASGWDWDSAITDISLWVQE